LDEADTEVPELLNARRLHHQKTPAPKVKKRASGAKKTAVRKKAPTAPAQEAVQVPPQINGHTPAQPVFPGFDLMEPAEAPSKPVTVAPTPKTAAKRTVAAAEPVKPAPRRRTKPAKKEALASH
jgi:hypothetical protein